MASRGNSRRTTSQNLLLRERARKPPLRKQPTPFLTALYPAQTSVLNGHLANSLAAIPGAGGRSQSIARGRAWGRYVANQLLALRSTDGWTTVHNYLGSFEPGVWRSIAFGTNADGSLPAAFSQVAFLAPFAMETPSQFRPGPPYNASTLAGALASPQYAVDLNEVKAIGHVNSATRTTDQGHAARLWQAVGLADENRAARSVVPSDHSLVENARLFALLNIIACDALIASMDSKFAYNFWRPHHAIRYADLDGNPGTEADPLWSALILAPSSPKINLSLFAKRK